MMSIIFTKAPLTADHAVKQKAALRQMGELNERIAPSKKYRTLTPADRKTLLHEGYAKDLVDNIVFMTERLPAHGLEGTQQMDQIVTGFTYAAFDPSLYASQDILDHLSVINHGRCALCESFLADTGAGQVTHFRPVWCVIDDDVIKRSPYYLQAYTQENFLYTCKDCGETFKNDYFPVKGPRSSNPQLENSLLIDPYTEQPRDFIRFNPLNGEAYAFDSVCAFYVATFNYSIAEVEQLLWQSPANIPQQVDALGNSISSPQVNQQFLSWTNNNPYYRGRGKITIDTLGLNRAGLVRARNAQLIALQSIFMQASPSLSQLDQVAATQKTMDWLKTQNSVVLQYLSLSIDSLQTMVAELFSRNATARAGNTTESKQNIASTSKDATVTKKIKSPASGTTPKTNKMTAPVVSDPELKVAMGVPGAIVKPAIKPIHSFPRWLTSSLIYFVLEKEMHMDNKRRLVYLAADDYLYGAENREKCVFLPIDWKKDNKNIIKVRAASHIWETSFQELADSRPLEIRSLFAHHEIWAEGDYAALTSS